MYITITVFNTYGGSAKHTVVILALSSLMSMKCEVGIFASLSRNFHHGVEFVKGIWSTALKRRVR